MPPPVLNPCVLTVKSTPCKAHLPNTPCKAHLPYTPCKAHLPYTPCKAHLPYTPCKILFTVHTLQDVWMVYKVACEESDIRAAAYSTFCSLWRTLIPHIMFMKPMSDLCWVCQQNRHALMRAANTPEEEKSEVTSLFS